jgi:hypothetical protein
MRRISGRLKRLTLQAGLRYERAYSFGPGDGENAVLPNRFNPTGVEFPRSTGVTGQNDISPRFGLRMTSSATARRR